MINTLQDMEKARQEMKRQAFERVFFRKYWVEWSEDKQRYDCVIGLSDPACAEYNKMWDVWQAAQEQMLQASTWNDYSLISPAADGRYQIFINGEQVAADWIDKFGFADPFEGDALRQDLITHWQPLPQPPKQ